MSARTAQLQIRVTPTEKAALRRLARASGETISSYVLNRVLPSAELELSRLLEQLRDTDRDYRKTLSDFMLAVSEMSDEEFSVRVPEPSPETALAQRNRVAALVETESARRGLTPPEWTWELPALERPLFVWPLPSLKPHQMRVTPAAFKRRNLFFDPASGPAPDFVGQSMKPEVAAEHRQLRLLMRLDRELAARGLSAELYLVGGAVLTQAFALDPKTANVTALFRATDRVLAAIRAVAEAEGEEESWHHEAVRRLLTHGAGGEGRPFVELERLRVFEPLPAYVLALKCAAMRYAKGAHEAEDVRYLLRAMNLTTADAAVRKISSYVSDRQLPPDIASRLRGLLGT